MSGVTLCTSPNDLVMVHSELERISEETVAP